MLQNSQENTCARVFFNKVAGFVRFPVNFVKLLRTTSGGCFWKQIYNKIKGNSCFLHSTILINEINVLQNSQFDLTFLEVYNNFIFDSKCFQ